jgi:amino-acid N-acetyltransferase
MLHALIAANREEGHLLPRALDEIREHAGRFVVALDDDERVVGCAELAPLGPRLAEIRSLAVDQGVRGGGVGAMLVDELRSRAQRAGFGTLCAFTHRPEYFRRMGFTGVSHLTLNEKIVTDCMRCPLFGRCGQHAMMAPLDASRAIDQSAARCA